MNLQEAIKQYIDMAKLGARTLERLSEDQLRGQQQAELRELMNGIVDRANRLLSIVESPRRPPL